MLSENISCYWIMRLTLIRLSSYRGASLAEIPILSGHCLLKILTHTPPPCRSFVARLCYFEIVIYSNNCIDTIYNGNKINSMYLSQTLQMYLFTGLNSYTKYMKSFFAAVSLNPNNHPRCRIVIFDTR